MPEETISFPELSMQEYLVQAFHAARERAPRRGALSALRRLDDTITLLLLVTHDHAFAALKLDLLLLMAMMNDWKTGAVQEFVKDNIGAMSELGPEAIDALVRIVDATVPDSVMDDEHVVAEKVIESLSDVLPLMPLAVNKEAVVQAVMASYQAAWRKVVYVDMPSDLEPFFDKILEALKSNSFETAKDVFDAEIMRWHDRVLNLASRLW